MDEKPDLSDDSAVLKAFELYEGFLSNQSYLAADHVTLAGICVYLKYNQKYCTFFLPSAQ